uniref:Uncharacterized protein n=1 Tax=Leptocylindrus danicus TaxID=163516 RepID=A0A7S2PDC7_9STRA|mmetsp:Transcript_30006/g.44097  ORF Transcript_30006/g.44097 Transcript_30006/m.44097 type:complete len:118 (+) Transcript_30006:67-420(+)
MQLLQGILHRINITSRNQILNFGQSRDFSKFLSKSARKRLPLTSKRAKKGYVKGKGCTREGRNTSKGGFVMDPQKMLTLIIPDLEGFKLKPYIAAGVSKVPPEARAEGVRQPRMQLK